MKYILITLGLALLAVGVMTVFSHATGGVPGALLAIAGAILLAAGAIVDRLDRRI